MLEFVVNSREKVLLALTKKRGDRIKWIKNGSEHWGYVVEEAYLQLARKCKLFTVEENGTRTRIAYDWLVKPSF